MSEAVSALPNAVFDGLARIEECGLSGMITLRGDLGSAKLMHAVTRATGLGLPETGQILSDGSKAVGWMSPDELLILCNYGEVAEVSADLEAGVKGVHALVANVSDARARFCITGPAGLQVLGKLTPADLRPAQFGEGALRRSRLAQVPAAFWRSGPDQIDLVCFRSVAEYVFGVLSHAAHPDSAVHK